MDILVRKLIPDDAAAYHTIRLDALRDSPTAFASSYEEEEQHSIEDIRDRFRNRSMEDATFGAFHGERLIGLTAIFRETRLKRQHKMWLVSVFVYPEYRGQKIGHKLVEAAIAHARTVPGVERIELGVRSDNVSAIELYKSLGFESWGTEPDWLQHDGKRYDEEHMTLLL